jgi:hypothetical protein
VGEEVGYPYRIADPAGLQAAYDASGRELMHLQAGVEGYDVFTRGLAIGPQTMVMHYDPTKPLHLRYQVDHDFLTPEAGNEIVTFGSSIGAFFRWEFNSFEVIVRDGACYPIDFANATPDMALISLHYYFPWALCALAKWSLYCVVTGRAMRLDTEIGRWYAVADDPGHLLGGEAGRLPGPGRRLLRGRPLPRVLRPASGPCRRLHGRVHLQRPVRRPPGGDHPPRLPPA